MLRIRGLSTCSRVGMMIRGKQIVIKKRMVKFPQWEVAIGDGMLIEWNDFN
ncbi:hypothetical protein LC613_38035 [Nostoc sphaeroides CHAB 2801]|uniref:hypothetical protein n=1 Tax=Nostoc sphaeroides TaxID=446679 RepID=UPI001E6182C6|nr:hypothetical protein [Nostoc sphaeroides]MCC5633285.1 hypothetical protein [Nostoc sphaeroides CHAB 2801]